MVPRFRARGFTECARTCVCIENSMATGIQIPSLGNVLDPLTKYGISRVDQNGIFLRSFLRFSSPIYTLYMKGRDKWRNRFPFHIIYPHIPHFPCKFAIATDRRRNDPFGENYIKKCNLMFCIISIKYGHRLIGHPNIYLTGISRANKSKRTLVQTQKKSAK